MKRQTAAALCAALVLLLGGCSAFEREYLSVQDYTPPAQEQSAQDGRITVRSHNGLRQALLNMAYAGQTEGVIVFDAAYDGDPTEDMASACWAVRTQDALCAYCVENIAYELSKIVTIREASVYLSYSQATESPESIRHLAFSSEAETELLEALGKGERRVALLVARSGFSADDMAAQVTRAYRANPTVVPREPQVSVNIFSGTGTQRLYEINFRYGLSQEELDERRARLEALEPFDAAELEGLGEAQRALAASRWLAEHCALTDSPVLSAAYDALVGGQANSEGVAFGYVALCQRLGLNCRIVYGQYAWQEHCWNIVRVDGSYYHVDVSALLDPETETAPEEVLLCADASFWGPYRWDVASYPRCAGTLRYEDLAPTEAGEEETSETAR